MTPRPAPLVVLGVVAGCIVSSLLLGGCGKLGDYAAVINGNRLYARGLYQEAAASYLSVAPGTFGAVLRFDLANVYARLGEQAAASALYAEVRKTGDPGMSEVAWYNEGILLYEKGRYEAAYKAFRAALAIDPRDQAARRNLEIAYRDWQRLSASPPERAAQAGRSPGGSPDQDLLLLRRLETGRFRMGSQAQPAASPDDY